MTPETSDLHHCSFAFKFLADISAIISFTERRLGRRDEQQLAI
jgi:hypothetical protein